MIGFTDYIKAGVVGLLAGMLLAGAGVWWAKDQQVKAVKVEMQTVKDANEANQKTIENQKEDIRKANEACTARISNKDMTIKRLQEIDSLVPGVINETSDTHAGGSGDPILNELNGMWDKPDRQD